MLSERERKILRLVQLRANESVASLSTLTGLSDQAVRYGVRGLIEKKVIRRSIAVNFSRLGLQRYNLLFSAGVRSDEERERLVTELSKHSGVSMLAGVGGDVDFEVSFLCRHVGDLVHFLDYLSSLANGFGTVRGLALVQRKSLFGSKFLDPSQQCESLECVEGQPQIKVDQLDYDILYALANAEYDSFRDLARHLDMQPSKLHYRIETLERDGVIVGHYYIVNDSQVFGMLHFVITLMMRYISSDQRAKMRDFCRQHPGIDILTACVGNHDFEVTVQADSFSRVSEVRYHLLDEFGEVIYEAAVIPRLAVYRFSDFPLQKIGNEE